jgi:O-antigen/teichoic acid export membrane protein
MTNNFDKIKKTILKFKDLTSLGIANILSSAISGIFWIYLATVIDTDSYGEIGYYITIASVAAVISSLGASNFMTVYTAKGQDLKKPLTILIGISSIVTSLVLFLILFNLGVSIYILGYAIFSLFISELLGKKLYVKFAKITVIQRALMVGLAFSLFYVLGSDGVIVGISLSFIPFVIIFLISIKNKKNDFSNLKNKKSFLMNNYVLDLSRTFSGSLDKIIIAPIFGFAILGNYYLGMQIFSILLILPSVVFYYILPQDASGINHVKLKKILVSLSVFIAIVSVLLAPYIIPYLFPKFTDAIQIIQILSIGLIPATINLIFISEFLGAEKSKIIVYGSGVAIIIQIPSIFVLGDLIGVNGLAIASVLAGGGEAIFLFVIKKRRKINGTT